MAWLERRGKKYRALFRLGDRTYKVSLKTDDKREAIRLLDRIEENIRLIERGRLEIPNGANLGMFLLSDGKISKPINPLKPITLAEMFNTYQTQLTLGSKEAITRRMEDVRIKQLIRIMGAKTNVTSIDSAAIQKFVDRRSRETYQDGRQMKPQTVRKAVEILRVVWNWAFRQNLIQSRYPFVELVFPKKKAPEPFRTFDQISAIIGRGTTDPLRVRELWDGLFLSPAEVNEALAHVKEATSTVYLYPFLATAAYTGARRSELFRARMEDFDFGRKLIHLREKKRSKLGETFRVVDMSPRLEAILKTYFENDFPGGELAFCSKANKMITDGQASKAIRTALKRSKWKIIRGYHTFRHSFASNLAAAGVDQRIIDELMGHTTLDMQKRYRHLFPDVRRTAVMTVYGD